MSDQTFHAALSVIKATVGEEYAQAAVERLDAAGLLADDSSTRRIAFMDSQIQQLLNHCPDAECSVCAQIICPHGESLHFHHDGCPSCAGHQHGIAA